MGKTLQIYEKSKMYLFALLSITFCVMNATAFPQAECPPATLRLPEIPQTLYCSDAEYYEAPAAYYDNDLTGECENNGYIQGILSIIDSECDSIQIVYEGTDDFGNMLDTIIYIRIESPMPSVDYSRMPDTINCEEVYNNMLEIFYTNGETGLCEVSGSFMFRLYNSGTPCEGGSVSYWDVTSMCGSFMPYNIDIVVKPAPLAKLTVPSLPESVSCEDATSFRAADATFTNGLTGQCGNSGSIPARVVHMPDSGYVKVIYEGADNCGHDLSTYRKVRIFDPDPVVTEPDFPESITVAEAMHYIPPKITYTNGLSGDCEISGSFGPDDFNNYWDVCNGGYILLTYAKYLDWLNDVYFTAKRITVTPDGTCLSNEYCTLTQDSYGSPGGDYCNGQSERELMDQLLLVHGGMVLGVPANNRTFTIPPDGGQCLEDILPGSGSPKVLPGELGCGNFGDLLDHGSLHNSLLAQTITTWLNFWLTPSLSDLVLESSKFFTVSSSGCGGGTNTPLEDTIYYSIPADVYDYIANKTVQDILDLANEALGTSNWSSSKPSLSDITTALTVINEAFKGCRFIYFDEYVTSIPVIDPEKDITLTVAPNPFRNSTEISFSVKTSSVVSAEIYDMEGRLVKKLYEGNMLPGEVKTLYYSSGDIESQSPRICVVKTSKGIKHQLIVSMH